MKYSVKMNGLGSLNDWWNLVKATNDNNEWGYIVYNSLESKVAINRGDNKKETSFFKMKFGSIDVCQNEWYKYFCITISKLVSYNKKFLNGNTNTLNGKRKTHKLFTAIYILKTMLPHYNEGFSNLKHPLVS